MSKIMKKIPFAILLINLTVILFQNPMIVYAAEKDGLYTDISYEWSSDGQSYYENGKKVTGQKYIDGYWYYFDDSTGKMVHGFKYIAAQKKTVWYGLETGHMLYGQQRLNGYWYYLNEVTGAVTYGWKYIKEQDKTVYYDKDGHMVYGKQTIDGKSYEFDSSTGALIKGASPLSQSTQSSAVTNGWNSAKDMYYLDGKKVTGQKYIDGYWYYFSETTGKMIHGWKYITDQKKTVWYGQETGRMLYGEVRIDGYWFYLNDVTGARTYGWKKIPGKNITVYYNDAGRKLFGMQTIGGKTYYLHDETGNKIIGFAPVDSKGHYAYTSSQGIVYTGQYTVNGNNYYFSEKTGHSIQGWLYIPTEDKIVYYDNTSKRVSGTVTIDGKNYNFDAASGALRNIQDLDKSVISKAIASASAISRTGRYGIVTKNNKKYVVIAGKEYESQNTDKKVNVLFIGNSYTYYNKMPSIFKDIAVSAGVNLDVTMIASGSTTFWGHFTDPNVKSSLRSGKYDYVVLQGQSTEVQENWEGSHISAKYLIDLANEKKPAIYLFEQMSYRGDPGGQPRIHTTYTQISEENGGIPVIHAGEAFWKYASEHPSTSMFSDDRHPSKIGSQVLAQAIWDGMKVDILYNLK